MILSLDVAGNVLQVTPGFTVPFLMASTGTFIFDESTNTALATDLVANRPLYKVVGGNLQKSGVTQAITAASATFTALQSASPNLTEAQFDAILGVLQAGTATLIQVNTILFNVLLKLRKAGLI